MLTRRMASVWGVALSAAAGAMIWSGAASAGAMAVSVLEVNNFQIKNAATGAQLVLDTDITILAGGNTADVSAELNGTTDTDSDSSDITPADSFGAIDLGRVCVGACGSAPAENTFAGFGTTPPPTATYSSADMLLGGAAVAIPPAGISGGADAQTRADVSLAAGLGSNDGSSASNIGANVDFSIILAASADVFFSLDYIVDMLVFNDETAPGTNGTAVQAGTSWILNITDPTGASIFSFNPGELNNSRGTSLTGTQTLMDSGTVSSSTVSLAAGTTYGFSLRHGTTADARFVTVAVPEPSSLLILGTALFGLGLAARRQGKRL